MDYFITFRVPKNMQNVQMKYIFPFMFMLVSDGLKKRSALLLYVCVFGVGGKGFPRVERLLNNRSIVRVPKWTGTLIFKSLLCSVIVLSV